MSPIRPENVDALIARVVSIEADVDGLQTTVSGQPLAPDQQQYLARCFDLLHMELTALRSYIDNLR